MLFRSFAEWAETYARRTAREIDASRLADAVLKIFSLPAVSRPATLVAYAFDIMPPQTADFLRGVRAAQVEVAQCNPHRGEPAAVRTIFPSAREELEAAAQWARTRLEEAQQQKSSTAGGVGLRIGVVVPDLQQRRAEVARVFSRVMVPGWNLPGAAVAPGGVRP